MSSPYEIRREGEVKYSKPLARALLRDKRLSFGARGLFSFLWDLPAGWKTNSEHLALMSPQGRDAVRTLLKELEKVGAMRSEPIRNERGRMAGKRWILISPEIWASESALSTNKIPEGAQSGDSTERRVSRPSDKSTIGEFSTKVLQGEGSSIKSTTSQVAAEIDDLVAAAAWACLKGGGKIQNEAGFRHTVRARILSSPAGASPEDVRSLLAWRAERIATIERDNRQQLSLDQKTSKELRASHRVSETERVIASFELLDITMRDTLLQEFAEDLLYGNTMVNKLFKQSGIQKKIVRTEFAKFISNTMTSFPSENGHCK